MGRDMAKQSTKDRGKREKAGLEKSSAVTLRDVAKACGLSVYPVSRALSGKPGVTPETLAKVRKAADELGYNYGQNDLARRLAMRKSGETPVNHVVGLLMPNHVEEVNFFFSMFRGISTEISAGGYGLLMLPTYDQAEHRELTITFPPSVMRGEVDGLIAHTSLSDELLSYLREDTGFGKRPIIGLTANIKGCPSILPDVRLGAKLALEHLLALGHRRILYFHKDERQYPGNERLAGYQDACQGAGLEPINCLIPVSIPLDHLIEQPLRQAIAEHPEATALLTHNDPVAISACYIMQNLGLRIPEDISVVGWDDTDPFPDATGENMLTSIHYDILAMGRLAARQLIARIEGRATDEAPLTMPPTLMPRGSTASPAIAHSTREESP
jgi:DNA-binding LacI/PurR family transcriptional regulator